MAKTIYICTFVGGLGCDRPSPKWGPLSFLQDISDGNDSGTPPEPGPPQTTFVWITSPNVDDGFGSAVVFGDDHVWIGAPHGEIGMVYKWGGSDLLSVLSNSGRLGSHLSWTQDGLWAAAPLLNEGMGAIYVESGATVSTTHPASGIALTSSGQGAYGWANGWSNVSNISQSTVGRPSSLHINEAGIVAVGMAHGPVYLQSEESTQPRIKPGDEAGFSLASGDLNNDQIPEWIIGAPGKNEVFALDSSTYQVIKRWDGAGRFGHAIAVCTSSNDQTHLLVGAPLAEPSGTVSVFTNFSVEPTGTWKGLSVGAELGTALACKPDGFLAGAPGNAYQAGAVLSTQGFLPNSDGPGAPVPVDAERREEGTGESIH